jgi:hypothetical protein
MGGNRENGMIEQAIDEGVDIRELFKPAKKKKSGRRDRETMPKRANNR